MPEESELVGTEHQPPRGIEDLNDHPKWVEEHKGEAFDLLIRNGWPSSLAVAFTEETTACLVAYIRDFGIMYFDSVSPIGRDWVEIHVGFEDEMEKNESLGHRRVCWMDVRLEDIRWVVPAGEE